MKSLFAKTGWGIVAAALALFATSANAQLLQYFGPVNGVLVGASASNPQTHAAAITDIQGLLSTSPGVVLAGATGGAKGVGTINATALYINGAAVGTSSGAVSSVGFSVPGAATCLSTTGSPVTSAGTLGLVLGGTSTQYLTGIGTCAAFPVAAPSATVGPTATTGSTGNFMDAGSAPALCLTCTYTQTGLWTFNGGMAGSGAGLTGLNPTHIVYPQTTAESAVSVTPTNTSVPPASVLGYVATERYGGAGDNSTANDTPFLNALKVAGQIGNTYVGLQAGGTYLFTAPIVMGAATNNAYKLRGIGGVATISCASGLTSTQDCLTVGNDPTYQALFQDISIQCNAPAGRDCLVLTGSNKPWFQNITITNSTQDAFVISVTGFAWVEKLYVNGLYVANAGRNGVRMQLAGTNGAYINESTWIHYEVRKVSARTAGGAAVYMTSTATGGGSKFSDHTFIDPNWDSQYNGTAPAPNVSVFAIDSGGAENFVVMGGGWESTGAASPGAGFHQNISGSGVWNGYSVLGVLTNSFWASGGVNPAVNNVFNSDYSFNRTQLMPLTIKGVTGVPAITATGVAGATAISASGGLNSATISVASGNTATNTTADVQITRAGSTANAFGEGPSVELIDTTGGFGSMWQNSGGQTEFWQFSGGFWSQAMHFGTTKGVVVGTPTGGDEGLGTVNMQACFINGVACATTGGANKIAAGTLTTAPSSCTINQNDGGLASCNYNSTGNVTVIMTGSFFGTHATCVAGITNGDTTLPITASTPGSGVVNSVNVLLRSTTGVFVDGVFTIICTGT